MTDDAKKVRELLDYDGESGKRRLTSWEVNYIDTLSMFVDLGDLLTVPQRNKLNEIWSAVFG